MKGPYEFEFEGKTRGFLFNFLTLGIFEENCDTPLDEVLERFGKNSKKPKITIVLKYFHAAAVNYSQEKGRPIDFTLNDVSEWVQYVGFDKCATLMASGLTITTPKNSNPLLKAKEGKRQSGELVSTTLSP